MIVMIIHKQNFNKGDSKLNPASTIKEMKIIINIIEKNKSMKQSHSLYKSYTPRNNLIKEM